MRWQPHVTVAAIIEHDDRFLLVKENINKQIVYNQPAGHWEDNETLIDAVKRETLEETGWHFEPSHLVGIYQWQLPDRSKTYLRFAFCGERIKHDTDRLLDKVIVEALWLTLDEIKQLQTQLRSPQVLNCIEDYLSGTRQDMGLLKTVSNR